MKRTNLLLVANQPSDNTRRLAAAVQQGAMHADFASVAVHAPLPLAATAEDVLRADAVILGTTENFGYISGQMKDFLERIYYPCLDKTNAKPWALYIRAGKDGTNTHRAMHSIIGGLRWREVQSPLMMVGDFREEFVAECETLGMTLAAGLDAGLY